ncbi:MULTISPECIES: TMEM165/GDT1 family protein [Sporomusa]|jgi:putative Ca2+/H+ antiporter (TMEM165/GDT1 family)|uniref:TMEM165/GDT1 family protein n=1 Tax=Sporomusa TaxID=2375 RepID=UPI003158CCE1
MEAFITASLFVVLAEMGDKTQLLGMAFATKYRWQTVMCGVFVATVLNHLLAVVVGSYITNYVPMSTVQIVASLSFIVFGLWTIRGDQLEGEDRERSMSPFWTVTVAFFIAEMGDKTQLATVALAAKFPNEIVPVWMGTTIGMMIANAIGILIGVVLGKQIPERIVKWGASLIFIFFGILGLYDALPREYLSVTRVSLFIAVLIALIYFVAKWGNQSSKPTPEAE